MIIYKKYNNKKMKALILEKITSFKENNNPLKLIDIPIPELKKDEVLLKISSCGVCHTELDEIEGRTSPLKFPIILGHQVVGRIERFYDNYEKEFKIGDRVGVAWIGYACGQCKFCKNGEENLCNEFKATGRDINGGYAEYMSINKNFIYKIPDIFNDMQAAPLLCAGAIGYRSLKLTGISNGHNLGLTGFGASAHIVLQIAKYKFPDSKIFVFARNKDERMFSKELGAFWAGDTTENPSENLDAIIDTTPVWKPVIEAMKNLNRGGRLVINAIRKENIDKEYLLNLNYENHLWYEKEIKSVANITRNDVKDFLELASKIPIKPEYQEYKLEEANKALMELKNRQIRGAKVLKIN